MLQQWQNQCSYPTRRQYNNRHHPPLLPNCHCTDNNQRHPPPTTNVPTNYITQTTIKQSPNNHHPKLRPPITQSPSSTHHDAVVADDFASASADTVYRYAAAGVDTTLTSWTPIIWRKQGERLLIVLLLFLIAPANVLFTLLLFHLQLLFLSCRPTNTKHQLTGKHRSPP